MNRTRASVAATLLGLFFSLSAAAQTTLSVQNLSMTVGGTAELRLYISDPETTFMGINVKLVMPAGITVLDAAPGNLAARDTVSDFFLQTNKTGATVATALSYSILDTIADGAGTILRLTLSASNDPADFGLNPGDTLKAKVTFSTSGLAVAGSQLSFDHATTNGIIELRTTPFGDVNGDGNVNATDIQRVINASLGLGSAQDIADADINGDGVVDAIDVQLAVLAVLGIYVPQSGSGKFVPPLGENESDTEATEESAVYAEVLPSPRPGEPAIAILADSFLYVRLRASEPIDPDSIQGTVTYAAGASDNVAWLPIAANDGWAVFWEGVPWLPGESVAMSVRGTTASGDSVGPHAFTFRVRESAEPGTPVWQPDYGDYDATALAGSYEDDTVVTLLEESAAAALPALDGGAGPVYNVAPQQVFDIPQRVWIPVPAGTDPHRLEPYVYLQGESATGWQNGRNVAGWLAPDSVMDLDMNEVTYIGFVVSHGATVQLGPAE